MTDDVTKVVPPGSAQSGKSALLSALARDATSATSASTVTVAITESERTPLRKKEKGANHGK